MYMVKDFLNVNTVKNNVYGKKYYLFKRLKLNKMAAIDKIYVDSFEKYKLFKEYIENLNEHLENKVFNKIKN